MFSDYPFFETVQTQTTTVIKGEQKLPLNPSWEVMFGGYLFFFLMTFRKASYSVVRSQWSPLARRQIKERDECETPLFGFLLSWYHPSLENQAFMLMEGERPFLPIPQSCVPGEPGSGFPW